MSPLRILIVDDHLDAATSLAGAIRLLGHIVQVANDGASAMMAAERFRPEIVLLDLHLPDMVGFETCNRIRQTLKDEVMAIFAVTGWGDDAVIERVLKSGFDGHFLKPVKLEDLLEAIEARVVGAS
jgi:CheY-like chemotaxis protein